jgi:uncharacterized membrane protein
MGKNRLEAFSDGVIAILITIMVLELKVPHSPDFRALLPLWPVFMSYVLSFIYIGIYWNKLQYGSYPLIAIKRAEYALTSSGMQMIAGLADGRGPDAAR